MDSTDDNAPGVRFRRMKRSSFSDERIIGILKEY
jgi:hypothetical protein